MSFQFRGLDHVQLAAPDGCEPVAREFFTDLLGWEEIPIPKNLQKSCGVWFQCGRHQVHVGVQKSFVPATKAHPAFEVENIAALRECLLRRHVDIRDDFERGDEGIKRFYLNDPFGNRLEFLEWFTRE